jgi:hypothetical protein
MLDASDGAPKFQVFLIVPHPEAIPLVIEPLTWGWLGLKLVEGVISGAGARLLNELIGGEGPITKQDLQALLNDYLHAISAVVKQQIEQNEIEKMQASAASAQNRLGYYKNNHDVTELPRIRDSLDEITEQAVRFTFKTVGVFAVTGSMELLVFQEIYLRNNKNRGDKKNIADCAARLLQYGARIQPALAEFNNSRFGDIHSFSLSPRGWPLLWSYLFEGQSDTRLWCHFREECEKMREEHMASEYAYLECRVLWPFYPVMQKWKEIAQGKKNGRK